ncbi:hypothetical protein EMIHUDRAFT_234944 [Emiliania huxleyi CCMP1516]|uniref:UTP23 sensor motif region domain-containing protein n=2 Tax=Emiliania huxleyi TaxID=2903 RepID=A0A0D3JXF9_EMIH1|nr:hypothetical protein EMIHUDRAFT_234944 [Emiliania huxleyi CCMP1516]EOD28194.1 hypothetical protein EMIHUDRAFT_234944 [Emiliania huxleyi CCMP1516]|eukprot:XP_005780623.1 hypothetical protein EMIHUDRAFT_234944 [Emiliania huxleyi CCMP1516]
MRIGKKSRARRTLGFYRSAFGIKQPYRVLAAANLGLDLRVELPKVLGGRAEVVVTRAVVAELRSLGKEFKSATATAKRLPKLDSTGSGQAGAASASVLSAVENGNARRLCVLTEDAALQQRLAALSGVPLLRFARQVIVLEPPQRDERAAAEGAAEELARANDRRAALAPDAPDAAPKKRKRLREPNPLSCKKKKPAPAPTSSGASGEAGIKKKNRENTRLYP